MMPYYSLKAVWYLRRRRFVRLGISGWAAAVLAFGLMYGAAWLWGDARGGPVMWATQSLAVVVMFGGFFGTLNLLAAAVAWWQERRA